MDSNINIKLEVIKKVVEGVEIIVIDPESEYQEIIKMLGGKPVTINPDNFTYINPFELEEIDT
ncbi:hypothetical protein [Tissierella sp.]|uniref:hypothetical protein n=1 Tax=Tissierella sp. TaxID=41274 RepID=UPI003062D83E